MSARALHWQLIVLALLMWVLAAINVAAPGMRMRSGVVTGSDFVHFYVLGSLGAQGRADLLYDIPAQRAEQERLIPATKGDWFVPVYGPQAALVFAPFSRLPYLGALVAWLLFTAAVYSACVRAVWRTCAHLGQHRLTVVLCAIAFPPFWALINYGQTSALPLLCVTAGWLALRADRHWWAGFALGSLMIKPQLGIAVAAVMLARRQWRIVLGALAAIAAQWAAAVAVFGFGPMKAYFRMLLRGPAIATLLEPVPANMHSLRGFWSLLCPEPAAAFVLYVLSSVCVLAIAVLLWRPSVPVTTRYSGLLLSIVLVSPHMTVYDLVVLAPAFLLTGDAAEGHVIGRRRLFRALLYCVYVVPLTGPWAGATRLQLSVPALVAWLVALWLFGMPGSRPAGAPCSSDPPHQECGGCG